MNKQELINAIAATEHFQTKKAAKEFLNEFLDIITDTIVKGTEVRISGFGKFEKYTRTNGSKTPKFRPFNALKTKVA